MSALLAVAFAVGASAPGWAADLADGEELFRTGQYDECIRVAARETARHPQADRWAELKARSEVARGDYDAAARTLRNRSFSIPDSLPVLTLLYEVYRDSGREQEASAFASGIKNIIENSPDRMTTEGRVALGRFLLSEGKDAREVLEKYFTEPGKPPVRHAEAVFAAAELALAKHDYGLVVETLGKAPKDAARDSRYHHLLARAFAPDDRAKSEKATADALAINPRHVDSLLLRADQLIDAEDFAGAESAIKSALDVDFGSPPAWAYRAVIAHLRADPAGEADARKKALARWAKNPAVDHLIGRKLSQDYRFAEGAAYQRRALELAPGYLPAKAQLCQDLLRLGDEAAGWKLAAELFAEDGYDVVAYNLVTLRDDLVKFRTLTGDGFLLRMDAKEADLYGKRALEVLKKARATLGERYGVALDKPVVVELFPRKSDFAVRTFGLPGGPDGILGVCFGPVVTALSPAARAGEPFNWESVLWHEFCHTVTLHKTKNKMPRWLSEGISVYEETRENPGWGRPLTPRFREMVLGDDLIPLSKLSSAFLAPKSSLHLQFAYFESALAVEYLVGRFGFSSLKDVLDDLGAGLPINEALTRRTATSLDKLDWEFVAFAQTRAKATAADATWERPDLPPAADSAALAAWVEKHPKSFWGRQRLAAQLVSEKKWPDAEKVIGELRAAYPEYVGPQNAYELLADVYRQTANPAKEAAALEELAAKDGDVYSTYQRLAELADAAGDWPAVGRNAARMAAVNPLAPATHRFAARAADKLGNRADAIAAYRALLQLGDTDAARVHYQLAQLLRQDGRADEAKREVLKALEDAPRFRDAHRLLLELTDAPGPKEKP